MIVNNEAGKKQFEWWNLLVKVNWIKPEEIWKWRNILKRQKLKKKQKKKQKKNTSPKDF